MFDEVEYGAKRRELKTATEKIKLELKTLRVQLTTSADINLQKQIILKVAAQAKASGLLKDLPFDVQQQIIKMVVDRTIVNPTEDWFKLEGVIN